MCLDGRSRRLLPKRHNAATRQPSQGETKPDGHVRLQPMLHVNVPYLGGVDSALLEGAAAGVVGAQVAIFAPVTAEGAVDA